MPPKLPLRRRRPPVPLLASLLSLLLLNSPLPAASTRVVASLRSTGDSPLQHVEFCLDCPNPAMEGSAAPALRSAHGTQEFRATGDIVITVPNDGSAALLNEEELQGHIALMDRGKVPLLEKVLLVQAAGAVGAVLVDNGECSEDFLQCGRTGGVNEGGFAYRDIAYEWSRVTIPALLVSEKQGQRIKSLMSLREVFVIGHGRQLVPLEDPPVTAQR